MRLDPLVDPCLYVYRNKDAHHLINHGRYKSSMRNPRMTIQSVSELKKLPDLVVEYAFDAPLTLLSIPQGNASSDGARRA